LNLILEEEKFDKIRKNFRYNKILDKDNVDLKYLADQLFYCCLYMLLISEN